MGLPLKVTVLVLQLKVPLLWVQLPDTLTVPAPALKVPLPLFWVQLPDTVRVLVLRSEMVFV